MHQDASPPAATRVEPGHPELFVRLRKSQVQYPQILSAYDAVAEQVRSEGRQVTAPPREVYIADVASAALSDLVCEVAFPAG